MTDIQALIILACITAGTAATRFLAFVLFPEKKRQPKVVSYLSTTIPAAMMGLLVVYCLKDTAVFTYPYGLPEGIAVAVTAGLHLWRRNVLLSITVGTVLYMILVQMVFL
ncbi:MAG TPA: AzlD domain-containing protein [Candidatus Faecousia intestinigallinarum]|nr:AzlD domain-containing protein [Candidatus Faecousia intestinigallinarum]